MNKRDWKWFKKYIKKSHPYKVKVEPMTYLDEEDELHSLYGCYCTDDSISLSKELKVHSLRYALYIFFHEVCHYKFDRIRGTYEHEEMYCNIYGFVKALRVLRRKNATNRK